MFPAEGQDIEFIEDVIARIGDHAAGEVLGPAWERGLKKPDVSGVHGTLFYELEHKRKFYPNKRASDIDDDK